nr:zinc dependent phospholipase C family protein [uncultured Carboxylicivirga sp.]
MKKYMHAWLSLKAVEVLESNLAKVSAARRKSMEAFLKFINQYPDTFVRGAWFPDFPISDNIQGGHTWKYVLDESNGKEVFYRPPAHNFCLSHVQGELTKKVRLITSMSDLPDRCEALSQSIRDMIKITNSLDRGDIAAFNDTQIAIMFLMLSHYVADAHMPMHCDARDFFKPSYIHPDIEDYWQKEVLKYYKVNKKLEQFDMDENQKLQVNADRKGYDSSIIKKCNDLLENNSWDKINTTSNDWYALLGTSNKNVWDYLVSVCLVSFHMSLKLVPLDQPDGIDYDMVRIKDEPMLFDPLERFSPEIIADAINSIALVWLATWERWELIKN